MHTQLVVFESVDGSKHIRVCQALGGIARSSTGDRTEQPQSAEAPAAEPEEAEPAPKDVAAAEVEDETITEDMSEEEVIDDGQLYVVEERVIRRHPARILSDGTVEAETAEGWMRFENLEHLDEYLDAMEPARS